jgi:sulfhydrogenase subunit beta (sulfur reductase)
MIAPIMKKLRKENLGSLFDKLKDSHRVIGPKIEGSAIVLSEIDVSHIPAGFEDRQKAGSYRLVRSERPEIFSFSVGPDSFKRFLHPPVSEMFAFRKSRTGITTTPPDRREKPLAFIGIRACDLSALKLYDRIFLEGPVRDNPYAALRNNSFIIALNCSCPGDNCFCSSMGTGPEAKDGYDIVLTELRDSFLVESGTVSGQDLLTRLALEEATGIDVKEKAERIEACRRAMKKSVRAEELPGLIYRNLDHPHWADIAKRDLECGNCTQVCPTCFCNSTYDLIRLSQVSFKPRGLSGMRVRKWDSCFSRNFGRVHGGNFRPSGRARYRQWMSHKLAYTVEQFGLPGCVGCGRCITWCPAGIDITVELEALRDVR